MKKRRAILLVMGLGQGVGYLFLLSLGNLRENIIACQVGFFSVFLLYVASLFILEIQRESTQSKSEMYQNHHSSLNRRSCLIFIICFSLSFRLIMWLSTPTLSDDIYRYLWEGKILSAGINPFEYAPDDPVLEHLRDSSIFPNINHKDFVTIYPPLNQFIFKLCAQLSPTIYLMNMTFILFDLLTILILLLTLHTLNMNLNRVVIYAWNPLIIMEFAGSGHLDSAGIFFLMLTLYLLTKRKIYSATLSLSLSFLNKLLPIIFLPFILTKKKIINLCFFLLITVIVYLPFLSAGDKIFKSLIIYSKRWVFNASLYDLLLWISPSPEIARGFSAFLFLVIAIGLLAWYKWKSKKESAGSIYRIGFIVLGGLLLLTPVLHPWYICWIVPFLVILSNRAWIFLSGSVFLSYWVLKGYVATGAWEESSLVKMIEYIPFYSLLLYDTAQTYRKRITISSKVHD